MNLSFQNSRMRREARTVEVMIHRYCRDHHKPTTVPCAEFSELLAYALKRLDHCPFQEGKTTCTKCPVHCYVPRQRDRIWMVMRHSGPRILLSHPILALLHILDGLHKPPPRD